MSELRVEQGIVIHHNIIFSGNLIGISQETHSRGLQSGRGDTRVLQNPDFTCLYTCARVTHS